MAVFTGDEIFQVSIELEHQGQAFYKLLADSTSNQEVARLCSDLADQERQHAATFEKLRAATTKRDESRPMSWDELAFAQTLIEDRVLPDPDDATETVQQQSAEGSLDMAIRFEKDSVLFYQEIVPVVAEADRRAVELIVEEEKLHVLKLLHLKRQLAGS
jgi:rubrerythrin